MAQGIVVVVGLGSRIVAESLLSCRRNAVGPALTKQFGVYG